MTMKDKHMCSQRLPYVRPFSQRDSHILMYVLQPGYTKSVSAAQKIITLITCLFSAATGWPGFVFYHLLGQIIYNRGPGQVLYATSRVGSRRAGF
jgi:hypothetical protein